MRSLEEVRGELLDAVSPVTTELVPVADAGGRILAAVCSAAISVPPHDTVGMDGYAVQAKDLLTVPRRLRVIGKVAPGQVFSGKVGSGQAVRVFTGAPLPEGSDAVLCQEDSFTPPEDPGLVEVLIPAKPWEFVRFKGEDIQAGAHLLSAGTRLGPTALGFLAAAGIQSVEVRRRPRLGLLATGSELLPPGTPWSPGKIYDSNSLMLSELLKQHGADVVQLPRAADDLSLLVHHLRDHWPAYDALVTSGGASVGEPDLVRAAIREVGGLVRDGEVAMKPGKPFFWGSWQGRPLFGLPGNPVSAFVTAVLLVLPAIRRIQGGVANFVPTIPGVLGEEFTNGDSRRHFIRVFNSSDGRLRSSGIQASHRLASLAIADGLIDVLPGQTLPVGSQVEVHHWEWPAGCSTNERRF